MELAGLVRRLVADPSLREHLAGNAINTARQSTLDHSAAAVWELLNRANARKRAPAKMKE
jgi:hypothetical protein